MWNWLFKTLWVQLVQPPEFMPSCLQCFPPSLLFHHQANAKQRNKQSNVLVLLRHIFTSQTTRQGFVDPQRPTDHTLKTDEIFKSWLKPIPAQPTSAYYFWLPPNLTTLSIHRGLVLGPQPTPTDTKFCGCSSPPYELAWVSVFSASMGFQQWVENSIGIVFIEKIHV